MTTGFAKALDDMIAAIVNGGFMDDLSDDGVRAMADKIAANEWRTLPDGTQWELTFCDGSTIVFDHVE